MQLFTIKEPRNLRIKKSYSNWEVMQVVTLKYLGVSTTGYKYAKHGCLDLVIVGGYQTVLWANYNVVDSNSILAVVNCDETKNVIKDYDEEPYISTLEYIDLPNLMMIAKYKTTNKLSNEDLIEFSKDAETVGFGFSVTKSREELEENLYYIFEDKPSTNSLALAKQFGLNHRDVIRDIFKSIADTPLLYNDIHWNTFKYTVGGGATVISLYLEVGELVYQKFIQKLPSSPNIKVRMKRDIKLNEYFQGLMNLRHDMKKYKGLTDLDIKNILDIRKKETRKLMEEIYEYTKNYQAKHNKKINVIHMNRIIFNSINIRNGINSISLRSDNDRNDIDISLQANLSKDEENIRRRLEKTPIVEPKEYIRRAFTAIYTEYLDLNRFESDALIKQLLRNYEVDYLYDIIEK